MPGPILSTMELKRMPFARRPIAQPGTVLVFQMPDNQLVAPEPPYTTGETWWKGPKTAFVVDSRPHGAVFACKLPAAGDALFFDATIRFTWRVDDAVEIVRQQVDDPEAECETYLSTNLPTITRRHQFNVPAQAEADVANSVGRRTLRLRGRGICIEAMHAELRIPQDQINIFQQIGSAPHEQQLTMMRAQHDAEIQALKQDRMNSLISGGPESIYAFVMQQDPTKGMEVVAQMRAMADRDKQLALEAIKALIEGGEIRPGDLDGAVADAVNGVRKILGQYSTTDDKKPELPEAGTS